MKKVFSVILSLTLLLSCFSVICLTASAAPAQLDVPGNYTLANENANLALYIDSNTGNFAVLNQKSGGIWYSNPIDWESDSIAQGDTKSELNTKLTVQYLTSSYSTPTVTSDAASLIIERQGKDHIMTFYFKGGNMNFTIPILFSLKEDYLHVELMVDKIKELGDSRVVFVRLFQFFGAVGLNDTGYALLPDGTGSLMEFNRKVENAYEWGSEGDVYAPNPTETASSTYYANWNEPVRLPVYGMVKNNEAYVNIIESGAAVSDIRTYVSRFKNSYNTIYTMVTIRDMQRRRSSVGTSGNGQYYTDERPENYIARYYFSSGADASYIWMAEKYREYLTEEKGMQPVKESVSNALCVTLYGGVNKSKHFLGIPYTGLEALTTYKEAEELIDRLKEDQIAKTYINYLGWSGGLETTLDTGFSPNKKLGGKKGIKSLIKKASETSGVLLSFDGDLQAFYGGTSDIKKFKNTAYGLDSSPVTIFKGRISAAGALDRSSSFYQLIHPAYMLGYAEDFIANGSALGVKSFSFNSIGKTLYCAYNLQDTVTRDQSAQKMSEIYKMAAERVGASGIVSTAGGNGYAMAYVDNVVEAPVHGSHNNIAHQEVPFYQIVFRGYVNLASSAFNLDSEQDNLLLKLAETGMSLYYLLMDAPSTSFHDTSFTSSYACALDDHYDSMIAAYQRLKPVYDAVGTSTITNYEIISDDLRVTTFSNGAQVYVNYGDAEISVNGVVVGAGDFTVAGGANA